MNAANPSIIVKLELNVPTEIQLATSSGLEVRGDYGPQMLFSLVGNRRLYVPLDVGREIQSLSLPNGASFILTKASRDRERGFDWKVERKSPAAPANDQKPGKVPATQLEHALRTAVHAAKEAEHYASLIGYTVRFSEQSIKSMAISLLIQQGKVAA